MGVGRIENEDNAHGQAMSIKRQGLGRVSSAIVPR